jgi:hypothetical protein
MPPFASWKCCLTPHASRQAADYLFVEVSAGFSAHTGLENPVGKTMRELVSSIHKPWVNILARADRTRLPQSFEGPIASLDQRWFAATAFPIGELHRHRVAIIFNNVKAKRETESALEHMRVIAEGVETHEQLSFLEAQHCPEAQGFLFGRPVAADKFAPIVQERYQDRHQ